MVRRGQAQELERERVSGQERGQAWACLHVMRSSEHECGEFRSARTGLQECDCVLVALVVRPVLQTDLCVVQHGAAVLSSETKVSGHGECG